MKTQGLTERVHMEPRSVAVNRYRDHPIGVNNIVWGNDFPHPEGR